MSDGGRSCARSNEEADDIASSQLRYLRIPLLVAELQAATSVRAPEARLALLSQAARHYIRRALHRGALTISMIEVLLLCNRN